MVKKSAFFLAVAVVLAIALAGCGQKSGPPSSVAKVDGQPISGQLYYEFLSADGGRKVLATLVEQQVLINMAEKEGVPVKDEQIDKQIEVMKRDGSYDASVAGVGSEQALRDVYRGVQARINIGEKMFKFTDTELQGTYDTIKSRYVHGPMKQVTVIVTPDAKQLSEAQTALKNGMDFDAASVKYSHPGFTNRGQQPVKLPVRSTLPAPLVYAAEHTKVDVVSKPFSFTLGQPGQPGTTMHGILKVTGELPRSDLKFAQVKDEIRIAKVLQKIPMDPEFQKKVDAAKKKANVVVELPQFKYLAEEFKNPPPPMGMPMMAPPQGGARTAPRAHP